MANRGRVDLENWIAQLRKGALEFAVMLLLQEGRKYGLELIQTLEKIPGLIVTEGTIYPLLNRLKEEGWLVTEWVESQAGPPRKYYHLTAQGRQRLEAMIHHWQEFSSSLNDLIESKVRV
jgi:PadR family transcriptional regulator PadR